MGIKVQCADQTPPNSSRRGFFKNAAACGSCKLSCKGERYGRCEADFDLQNHQGETRHG
jgi:hypothetical protein